MILNFNLQLFGGGKGGSSTTIQSAPKTEEEKRLEAVQANYAEKTAPTALQLQSLGSNMILNNPGIMPVNYTQLGNQAVAGAQDLQAQSKALGQGIIPQAYLDNERAVINQQLQGTMGNAVNDLMARGVLGGSSTSSRFYDIGQGVSNAITNNFNNDLSNLSNNINQQSGLLSQPMAQANAAQNASIDIPAKILALSQGQQSDTSSLLNTLSSNRINDKTTTQTTEGSGLLGGLLGGIGSYYGAKR